MVVTSYEAPIKVFIFLMIYKQSFTVAFEEISPRFVGRIEPEKESGGIVNQLFPHVLVALCSSHLPRRDKWVNQVTSQSRSS